MKSEFELYDVKLNKNSALAYVRDINDERVIEPVALKHDFGEKLSTKLETLRRSDNKAYGNGNKSIVGHLTGVIAQDGDGYGHVDWSTVDVDSMKPSSTAIFSNEPAEFVNTKLKRSSIYGDLATNNIRPAQAGDDAILVLSDIDLNCGLHVMADGREALATNSKLPLTEPYLNQYGPSFHELFDKVGKQAFGQDFKDGQTFENISEIYAEPVFDFEDDSSEIKVVHHLRGTILDVADDIKGFAKANGLPVSEFFQKTGYNPDVDDSQKSRDFEAKFESYLVEHAENREPVTHYISNVKLDEKIVGVDGQPEFGQVISNFDGFVLDDASAKKYASEMTKVGFGTDVKTPYAPEDILYKIEKAEVQKQYDKFYEELDMDF